MSRRTRIIVALLTGLLLVGLPAVAAARHGHGGSHRESRGGVSRSTVAGSVASFQAGVLTIKQEDGTSASAKVTAATEIECEPGAVTAEHRGRGNDATDVDATEVHGGNDGSDDGATEVHGGNDADDAGTTTTPPTTARCGQTALTTGATVTRARIRSGAFTQIKVVR